ncbi:MAG: hypothetical protein RBS39_11670 [Phycisphaerales bacterium]|jgi:hypothetical protein|nr:hypothetical protein [Phycisphaerales bacterium]
MPTSPRISRDPHHERIVAAAPILPDLGRAIRIAFMTPGRIMLALALALSLMLINALTTRASLLSSVLPALPIALLGGLLSRSIAVEFSLGIRQGLRESWADMRRLMAQLLLLAIAVTLCAHLLASVGIALSEHEHAQGATEPDGGLPFFRGAISLGIQFVLLMLSLACVLTMPALTCEGSDAIDAAQRACAYLVAAPIRMFLILLGLMCGLLVWVLIVGILAEAPWLPEPVAWITRALLLIVGCAATTAYLTTCYLLIREAADGQDRHELWTPAMESTLAQEDESLARSADDDGAREDGARNDETQQDG